MNLSSAISVEDPVSSGYKLAEELIMTDNLKSF